MAQKEDLKFEIGFPKLIQLTFFCSFSKNYFRYIMLNWLSSFQPSFKTLPRKFRLILDMFSKFSSSYIIVLHVLTPPQKQPILFRYKCHPSIFYRLLEGRVREKDWENEDISGEKERKTTKHPEKSNGQLSMNSLSSLFPPFFAPPSFSQPALMGSWKKGSSSSFSSAVKQQTNCTHERPHSSSFHCR